MHIIMHLYLLQYMSVYMHALTLYTLLSNVSICVSMCVSMCVPGPYYADDQLEYLEEGFKIVALMIRTNAAKLKDDMKKEGTKVIYVTDLSDILPPWIIICIIISLFSDSSLLSVSLLSLPSSLLSSLFSPPLSLFSLCSGDQLGRQ